MKELPRFIKLEEDRINLEEIVSYGLAEDEDEDAYLYVNTSDGNDFFYYDENVEFDLDEKVAELDDLLLFRKLGHVDFEQR